MSSEFLKDPIVVINRFKHIVSLTNGGSTSAGGVIVEHGSNQLGMYARVCYSMRLNGCDSCAKKEECPVERKFARSKT